MRESRTERQAREAEETKRREEVLRSVGESMQPYRDQAATAEREAAARPQRVGMPVSTSNDVPGYEILGYVGEVFGNIVRSRGPLPAAAAQLQAGFVGGELKTMTHLLNIARRDAIKRLVEEAERIRADAVIAMRVDVTSIGGGVGQGDWTEVCAYGTAVRARLINPNDGSQ